MPVASGKEGSKFRCTVLEISDSRMICYLHANLSKEHGSIEDASYVRKTNSLSSLTSFSERIDDMILFSDEVKKKKKKRQQKKKTPHCFSQVLETKGSCLQKRAILNKKLFI